MKGFSKDYKNARFKDLSNGQMILSFEADERLSLVEILEEFDILVQYKAIIDHYDSQKIYDEFRGSYFYHEVLFTVNEDEID